MITAELCYLCSSYKELVVKDEHTGAIGVAPCNAWGAFTPRSILACRCSGCGLLYSLESIGAPLSPAG